MGIIVDIFTVETQFSCLKVHLIFMIDQLCFKKFGNVEDGGEEQSRKDESEKVNQRRGPNFMFSVEQGFADDEVSFCRYAHNQVRFPREHNVLQWIVEVGDQVDENHILETHSRVDNGVDEKQNVTNCKGEKALIECGF